MEKLSTSGAFIQWSMLLWLLPSACLLLSLWLRLGVFVTFACINMCTSRVFVIQLPLPGDIRFVIEDEEFEYKRGRVQLTYGCVHFVYITEEGICAVFALAISSKQVFMFNVIEWSLWPASHDCDIISLWLCLGVSVTFACINMCTSRVFVIQLPSPDDIRFVIEDEEVE